MPLVRISLNPGKSLEYRRALGDAVHRALVETIAIPAADRFQLITEEPQGGLIYDPGYLGIHRTDGVVFIQITLSSGRSVELRKTLFARIAQNLATAPGVRPEDVLINLVETAKENWSFGNGIAQYAT